MKNTRTGDRCRQKLHYARLMADAMHELENEAPTAPLLAEVAAYRESVFLHAWGAFQAFLFEVVEAHHQQWPVKHELTLESVQAYFLEQGVVSAELTTLLEQRKQDGSAIYDTVEAYHWAARSESLPTPSSDSAKVRNAIISTAPGEQASPFEATNALFCLDLIDRLSERFNDLRALSVEW